MTPLRTFNRPGKNTWAGEWREDLSPTPCYLRRRRNAPGIPAVPGAVTAILLQALKAENQGTPETVFLYGSMMAIQKHSRTKVLKHKDTILR
ncbi:hypothetical protein ACFS7Z_20055 [Pontibacter toksunensis]|uniref:Uncharacterized protein n=1 Tax=Pontibacter toksunensis TaxID=1332631 RepID=A0ABW6BY00_9BACT